MFDYSIKEARQIFKEYNDAFGTTYSMAGFVAGSILNSECERMINALNNDYIDSLEYEPAGDE